MQTRTHPSAHELTKIGTTNITLDVKGNTTVDPTKTYTHNYTWDFDNRMSAADADGTVGNEIAYTYDALGRRVSKAITSGATTTTTVYASMGSQVSSEYTANAAAASPSRKYVYGTYIDDPLILIVGTNIYHYHTNRQFSVTGLTNSSKTVIERYAYTPYGGTVILDAAATTILTVSSYGNPYMYTGRRFDPETGLYYYRARYYDVDLARFLGRDPIRYRGGMNLYAYVGGNP